MYEFSFRCDDTGVEIIHRHDTGTTWPELVESYLAFLRGCGFVLPDDCGPQLDTGVNQ